MSVARIANFGPSCDTSEGRFQVGELSDKKYDLMIGDIRLIRRLPLPIHICSGVTIAGSATASRWGSDSITPGRRRQRCAGKR